MYHYEYEYMIRILVEFFTREQMNMNTERKSGGGEEDRDWDGKIAWTETSGTQE